MHLEELLCPRPSFAKDEVGRLIDVVKIDAPNFLRFGISKFLNDLSWASSHLDGATYTQLDSLALIDGFDGKLTSSKWAAIAKCSQDTALRDITELLERGVLKKSEASGRSTCYELVV